MAGHTRMGKLTRLFSPPGMRLSTPGSWRWPVPSSGHCCTTRHAEGRGSWRFPLATLCTSRDALATASATAPIAYLDALRLYIYDPGCPSHCLSLGWRECTRGARLAVAGSGRGRHALGHGVADGVFIADHAAVVTADWRLYLGHRPECSGHGLAVSPHLSVSPRDGTG